MTWRAWVGKTMLLVGAYYATGRLSLVLAAPPGLVAPLWPPAGIALAAVLLFGARMGPGIFIGALLAQPSALLLQASEMSRSQHLAVVLVIAGGVTLQALAASWILGWRSTGSLRLDGGRDIFQFVLFGGLAGSLIGSTCGTASFWLTETLRDVDIVRVWSTWWMGDTLGVVLAGPLVIGMLSPETSSWKGRRLAVFGPLCVTVLLSLASYGLANRAQTMAVKGLFKTKAGAVAQRLQVVWRGYEAAVSSTATLFDSTSRVEPRQFQHFAGEQLNQNQGIVALMWLRRAEGEAGRHRVAYVAPEEGFEAVLGFDVASERPLRETLRRAASSGTVVASPPLRGLGPLKAEDGLVLVKAVYEGRVAGQAAANPRRVPRGFVMAFFRAHRLVGAALTRESWHGYRLTITDGAGERSLVYRDTPARDPPAPMEDSEERLVFQVLETFGRRPWQVSFEATPEYLRNERSWRPYGVLTEGMVFSGFVLAFLLVFTGRMSKVEQLVSERTDELRSINDDLAREVKVRQQAEEDLRLARDAAVKASRYKSEFLANMSHEIRTPLNAIIGFADLLSLSPIDGESRRLSSLIRTAGSDLMQVINAVLDYSKVEAGRLELEPRPFDVNESLRSIIELMSSRAAERGLELVLDAPDPVGGPCVGDEGVFRQVLLNLMSNALKFTEQGRVTLRVRHRPGPGDRMHFRFEVEDTGIGIAEEDRPRLFQKFFQVQGSSGHKQEGTGLGLAISKQLVELMGGTIGVTSQVGSGTTFHLELTMPLPAETEPPPTGPVEPGLQPLRMDTIPRVLVVDDHLANQLVLVKMLEKLGCEVDMASNGRQALDQLARQRYDLVLMDCNMPTMDGYEATRALRARKGTPDGATASDVVVVGVTAYAMSTDRAKCIEAGMNDHLPKPVSLQSLRQVLVHWTGQPAREEASEADVASGEAEPDLPEVRSHLDTLVSTTDVDTVRKVVSLFLSDAPEQWEELERAADGESLPTVSEKAHGLAGKTANIGARELSEAFLELERLAKSEDASEVRARLTSLKDGLGEVRRVLEKILPGLGIGSARDEGGARLPSADGEVC